MSNVTITRATITDLDALVPLFVGYLDFYNKPRDEAKARDFLEARLRNDESVVFLAHADGDPVGFVQLYPAFASTLQARSWILNDLFVAASARGRGVSKRLMDAARQLAVETGACELFLQTARDNTVAQSLYSSLGWVRDDAFLVYTLTLGG
ncbi:MAG: GNAT family N-acetyltransferase [Arenimonas sp.]